LLKNLLKLSVRAHSGYRHGECITFRDTGRTNAFAGGRTDRAV